MVEPEIAFSNLDDVISLAEGCLKSTVGRVLDTCAEEVGFFNQRIDPALSMRLDSMLAQPFARLSYTEAVEVLRRSGQSFESGQPQWGKSLQVLVLSTSKELGYRGMQAPV